MHETNTTYLLRLGQSTLDLRMRPCVMGILNVTPDSFSDGGRFFSAAAAVDHALHMIDDGADMLDIGGESTRPGAEDVPIDEELRRVVPVIESLRAVSAIPISIDTRKAAVADAAIAAGANIINDVSALRHDAAMADVAARFDVPVVLMHMQGSPATMQTEPAYADVVEEVHAFLSERLTACSDRGIGQVVLDPGIGFGKTLDHNLKLLRGLPRILDLGVPVLIGVSRKSFIGQLTGRPSDMRLPGSIAAAVLALHGGASIFRVHDVRETREALDVAAAILQEEGRHHAG